MCCSFKWQRQYRTNRIITNTKKKKSIGTLLYSDLQL